MTTRNHDLRRHDPFWHSGIGLGLTLAALFAAIALAFRHWEVFAGWLPLAVPLLICLGMHKFMHGGHRH